jgi:predicted secreted protein
MKFEITDLGTYAGSFCITSFEASGKEGAETARFSASFESSGPVTFTAA